MDIKEYIREDLWKTIEQHYDVEDYTEALRDASFLLKDILQTKSGEFDKDNTKLVDAVLSGQNPTLKINNYITQSEKDMQTGIAFGIKGIFMHVRNPISHEKIMYEKKDADAILFYIDYLLRQVDKSNGTTLIDEWLPLLEDDTFTDSEEYAEELIKEVPRKKVYELLSVIYDDRENIAQYKTKYFIQCLIKKLTADEKNAFINKINTDLAQTHGGYSLSMFFHFFGEDLFDSLKRVVKLRVEDIIYHGIKNAVVDLKDNDILGDNAQTATWANDFIEKFESKNKIKNLLFDKATSTKAQRDYVLKYYEKYVSLFDKDILEKLAPFIKRKISWSSGTYEFVREFIDDKNSPIYQLFKDGIDEYEEKYLNEEERIPVKSICKFEKWD